MDLSFPQAVLVPIFLLSGAAISLSIFEVIFTFVSQAATKSASNGTIKMLQPILIQLKRAFEHVLGKSFKFNLTHICLVAVIIALLGLYNALEKSNQLKERRLKDKKKK